MCHPENLADFAQIEIAALELESRSPRGHFQVWNLCQRVEYFFGNAVTEVGGVLIVAQIFERKYCNRFRRQGCSRLALSRRRCSVAAQQKEPDRNNCANDDNINPGFAA